MSVKTPSSAETAVPGFLLKAGVAAVCADWVGESETSDAYHCISPPKASNRAGASPMPLPRIPLVLWVGRWLFLAHSSVPRQCVRLLPWIPNLWS